MLQRCEVSLRTIYKVHHNGLMLNFMATLSAKRIKLNFDANVSVVTTTTTTKKKFNYIVENDQCSRVLR